MIKNRLTAFLLAASTYLGVHCAMATTIQFQTSLGDFEVILFDQDNPITVANFLAYLNAGSYQSSVVHRSQPGFVIQGGGFVYQDQPMLTPISVFSAINNEPRYSNVRGTIAMAKQNNAPNSATSQWFINLANNGSLDFTNSGFTVFGQVTGNGMTVVDAIASLPIYAAGNATGTGSAGQTMPLRDYDSSAPTELSVDNFVLVDSIVVLDADANSAEGLITAPEIDSNPPGGAGSGGDSGGSLSWWTLVALMLLGALARHFAKLSTAAGR
jgi:cyclophilin family peptidyl-prolyl cis-trans isomerase